MKAIVLTDGKAGHENQSKAFARALGCDAEIVPVAFVSRLHKTLSYLLDRIGVRTLALFKPFVAPDFASVVIGTGSGTFYAVKALARKIGAKSGVVLYPRGYDIPSFDCVMAPSFDSPAKAKNVVEIPANLVASDEAFYEKGVKAFLERHTPSGCKAVAVIIGGPNKCSSMTAEWMRSKLDGIFDQNKGCEMWVTTSRRTPSDVEAVIDSYPWDYRLIYSRDHFNPIPAFVKLADRLYVTAESTGMLSEACTFGTSEVVPLDNLNPGPHKFRRFLEGLVSAGYANGRRKINLADQFASAKSLLVI
jgi:hypothetical protein